MADKVESEKKTTGLMKYLRKNVNAPISDFMPEFEPGILSRGTKETAKGVASMLTRELVIGGNKTQIKNATLQTLMTVVKDLTKKGNKLTHDELDILLQIAADSKDEKQTLTLLQNTREPEKYPNKNLVAARVQAEDIVPVLKLLRKLEQAGQALVIVKKVTPGDVKEALPYLIPFVDKNIRLSLIDKCPASDLPFLFESFKAMPITKEEVQFLMRSRLRPGVVPLIFKAVDSKNYSPELVHWVINHTRGEEILKIYEKTQRYVDAVLLHSERTEDQALAINLKKLMFLNIAPDYEALTSYIQSSTPNESDLSSLKNIFSMLEKEGMIICTRSNAGVIYDKFLSLSYDISCLIGKQEIFDREKESAFITQNLLPGISTPLNIVNSAASQLLDAYIKAYGSVLATRYKRDEFPQFFILSRLLNEILQTFGRK